MIYQTSSHAVLQMEVNTDKYQESLLHKTQNYNIMRVGDNIMDDAAFMKIGVFLTISQREMTSSMVNICQIL